MPITNEPNDDIKIIQDNHKQWLENNLLTHLDLIHSELIDHGDPLDVEAFISIIDVIKKSIDLKNITQEASFSSKLTHGVLGALAGGIVGGGLAWGTQVAASPLHALTGIGDGVVKIGSNIFAAGLGALTAKVLYDQLNHHVTGEGAGDLKKMKNEAELSNAFPEEVWHVFEKLSEEMIQLFYFREMLLNHHENARTKLKEKDKDISSKKLNAIIEAYFLFELNKLFKKSLKDFYATLETSQGSWKEWLTHLFTSSEKKATSIQDIQIRFIEGCQKFLMGQLTEPSSLAKHALKISGITSFVVAAGVFTALLIAGPVGWGILGAGIGCVAAGILAFGATYIGIRVASKFERIGLKRDHEDRTLLKEDIKKMDSEIKRLKAEARSFHELVPRSDVKELANRDTSLFNLFGLMGQKFHACGSKASWLRTYASHIRLTKSTPTDDKDYRTLISKSEKQTKLFVQEINGVSQNNITSASQQPKYPQLEKFINDTKTFLLNAEPNQKSLLCARIKEQCFEIVASLKDSLLIPPALTAFYEQDLEGSTNDLNLINRLALADTLDPTIERLLDKLNTECGEENAGKLFTGDKEFTKILGCMSKSGINLNKINTDPAEITNYLNTSFEFLFSLALPIQPPHTVKDTNSLKQTPHPTDEFILYKTLLFKQLATLWDPANTAVSPEVKDKILVFLKFFNVEENYLEELLSQALINKKPATDEEKLAIISQAIRFDAAYNAKKITVEEILNFHLEAFIRPLKNKELFCYGDSYRVEATPQYVEMIKNRITNTTDFIENEHCALEKWGMKDCYIYEVKKEVRAELTKIIERIKRFHTSRKFSIKEFNHVYEAFTSLYTFHLELEKKEKEILDKHSNQPQGSTSNTNQQPSSVPQSESPTNQLPPSNDEQLNGFNKHLTLFKGTSEECKTNQNEDNLDKATTNYKKLIKHIVTEIAPKLSNNSMFSSASTKLTNNQNNSNKPTDPLDRSIYTLYTSGQWIDLGEDNTLVTISVDGSTTHLT